MSYSFVLAYNKLLYFHQCQKGVVLILLMYSTHQLLLDTYFDLFSFFVLLSLAYKEPKLNQGEQRSCRSKCLHWYILKSYSSIHF